LKIDITAAELAVAIKTKEQKISAEMMMMMKKQ
jgi:hypothetical protein